MTPKQKKIFIGVGVALAVIGIVVLVLWITGVFDNKKPSPPLTHLGSTYLLGPSGETYPQGSYQKLLGVTSEGKPQYGSKNADITKIFEEIYKEQKTNEYGNERVVFLLSPGKYYNKDNMNGFEVKLGYYSSVVGLGSTPDSCVFQGVIEVENDPNPCIGALNNFYRGLHNFTLDIPQSRQTCFFRTSQACPIRDIVIKNGTFAVAQSQTNCNNDPSLGGYSSGGFIANVSSQEYPVSFSTQQQFFTRNSDMPNPTEISGGAWNLMFMACPNIKSSTQCADNTLLKTSVLKTPFGVPSPPRLVLADDGTYTIVVPQTGSTTGYYQEEAKEEVKNRKVIFVSPNTTLDEMNRMLQTESAALVFAPGIYSLPGPLVVGQSDTVLLGLGYATLIPTKGTPDVQIANDATGCRVAGFIVQAGNKSSPALVQVGTSKSAGSKTKPTILQDIFTRVATREGVTHNMLEINQGYTVLDHNWNWRADHDAKESGGLGVANARATNGLVVNADNVTGFGIFSEHQLENCVLWNGDNGQLYFQQTELPYDVTVWDHPGLLVTGKNFHGQCLGIYSFFNSAKYHPSPKVTSGIVAPSNDAQLDQCFTRFLNGGGYIKYVVNQKGGSVWGDGGPSTRGPRWLSSLCTSTTYQCVANACTNQSCSLNKGPCFATKNQCSCSSGGAYYSCQKQQCAQDSRCTSSSQAGCYAKLDDCKKVCSGGGGGGGSIPLAGVSSTTMFPEVGPLTSIDAVAARTSGGVVSSGFSDFFKTKLGGGAGVLAFVVKTANRKEWSPDVSSFPICLHLGQVAYVLSNFVLANTQGTKVKGSFYEPGAQADFALKSYWTALYFWSRMDEDQELTKTLVCYSTLEGEVPSAPTGAPTGTTSVDYQCPNQLTLQPYQSLRFVFGGAGVGGSFRDNVSKPSTSQEETVFKMWPEMAAAMFFLPGPQSGDDDVSKNKAWIVFGASSYNTPVTSGQKVVDAGDPVKPTTFSSLEKGYRMAPTGFLGLSANPCSSGTKCSNVGCDGCWKEQVGRGDFERLYRRVGAGVLTSGWPTFLRYLRDTFQMTQTWSLVGGRWGSGAWGCNLTFSMIVQALAATNGNWSKLVLCSGSTESAGSKCVCQKPGKWDQDVYQSMLAATKTFSKSAFESCSS